MRTAYPSPENNTMRITGTSKAKHVAHGGPYNGEMLLVTKDSPRTTMTFKAKGMTGHYQIDSENRAVWIEHHPTK